jgi:hypothetical protein
VLKASGILILCPPNIKFFYMSETGRPNGGVEFLERTDSDYKWRLVCKNPSRFVNYKMLFNKKVVDHMNA